MTENFPWGIGKHAIRRMVLVPGFPVGAVATRSILLADAYRWPKESSEIWVISAMPSTQK